MTDAIELAKKLFAFGEHQRLYSPHEDIHAYFAKRLRQFQADTLREARQMFRSTGEDAAADRLNEKIDETLERRAEALERL